MTKQISYFIIILDSTSYVVCSMTKQPMLLEKILLNNRIIQILITAFIKILIKAQKKIFKEVYHGTKQS